MYVELKDTQMRYHLSLDGGVRVAARSVAEAITNSVIGAGGMYASERELSFSVGIMSIFGQAISIFRSA